jgi:hypothetical protein
LDSNSNFVSYELDAAGDLYLKYYFADNSTTVNESAVGRFSVGDKALEAADNEAIGLPFSVLPRQDLSIKGDWHSWSPKEGATWEDHVEFARGYAPGHIVAITKDSNLVSAAMSDIKAHNGRLAVVKITDQRARDAYLANPSLIPKQVSPGFMNLETPNLNGIQKVRWAHLAGVPKGAYGDKATLYASCVGGNECINHLVAASVKELDEKTRQSYCPIGASENLVNNSLGSLSDNHKTMSVNATNTTESQSSPITTTPPVVSSAPPKGAPINTTPQKGIVKLKNPVQANQTVTPQGNNPNPNPQGQGDVNELEAVKKTLAELQAAQQQRERLEQIKKVIPKELFINKGKFDEKGYEAEVEKRLQEGWTDDQLNQYYGARTEILKLTNAGYALPQEQQPQAQEQLGQVPNAPVGGSAYQYQYQTSSEVPAGENNDIEGLRLKAVNELRRWTRGY